MAIAMKQPSSLMLTSGASGRVNALCSLRALKTLLKLINLLVVLLLLPFRGRWRVGEKQLMKDDKGGGGRVKVVTTGIKTVPASPHACAAAGTVDHDVAVRRGLAMKRVMEDKDDGKSVREFLLFVGVKGRTLFTQCWSPINVKVRGLVIVLHGLNEHCGRYNDFAKRLNANGFKVFGMDWIGHGGSDGLHGYVHSLDDAVNDVKLYLDKVLAENPGLPCFFFGHSTGAAIVLKAALDPKVEARISGLVLTSPAVGVQPPLQIFVLLAPIVSMLMPRYQLSAANKQGAVVSRDPEALIAKYLDPLVFTGSIRVRTGYEILRISNYLQQNLSRMRAPFLVLHGSDDTITDPKASERLYVEASSTDKSIKLCKGLLHDLLFEPEREAIMSDIIEWLNCRV